MQRVLNQQQPLRLNQALHIQSMASKRSCLAIRIYRSRLVCHTSILLAYTNILFAQLSYASGSLRLYPRVDYSAKYQSASGSSSSNSDQVHADDVFGMIKEYLPSGNQCHV